MKRDTLNKLFNGLRSFRSHYKNKKCKYRFDRQGDKICIMLVLTWGNFRVNDYMTPEELLRWFEGYICASEGERYV